MKTFLQEPTAAQHLLLRPMYKSGRWTEPNFTFCPLFCLLCSPLGQQPAPHVPPAPWHPISSLLNVGPRSGHCCRRRILLGFLFSCKKETKSVRALSPRLARAALLPVNPGNQKYCFLIVLLDTIFKIFFLNITIKCCFLNDRTSPLSCFFFFFLRGRRYLQVVFMWLTRIMHRQQSALHHRTDH